MIPPGLWKQPSDRYVRGLSRLHSPGAKRGERPVESWLFLYGKWDHCLQPGGGRQ